MKINFSIKFRNYVTVLNKFNANGVSILSFEKHAFADRVFTSMLFYRKQSMHLQQFFRRCDIY